MNNPAHAQEYSRLHVMLAGETQGMWRSLKRSLSAHPGLTLSRSSSALKDTIRECETYSRCLLLLDWDFLWAFETLPSHITRTDRFKNLAGVIALVEEETVLMLEQVLRMGCMGMLGSGAPPRMIYKAIRAVASGEIWAPRKLLSQIVRHLAKETKHPVHLTDREAEIVALIGEGTSNRRAAEILGLSRETIRWNLRMIYRKTRIHDRHLVRGILGSVAPPGEPNHAEFLPRLANPRTLSSAGRNQRG